MADTRIYVMTHKKYNEINDESFHSLHVGRALSKDLGYETDNTGENISEKNKNYCELTGIYWVWKNVSCDNVGICHYRRFFSDNGKIMNKEKIEQLLSVYDCILPTSMVCEYPTVYIHFNKKHWIKDLDTLRKTISDLCPDYLDAFDLCTNCRLFSVGNMIITKKSLFDKYCEWLFPILFETEKQTDISNYDDYQARLYGFLSERLLRIWLLKNNYRVFETTIEEYF